METEALGLIIHKNIAPVLDSYLNSGTNSGRQFKTKQKATYTMSHIIQRPFYGIVSLQILFTACMVVFLHLDSATWPAFRGVVQILIKPSPNPLILRPNMVNCWEMMAGSMLPIHRVL